MKSLNRILASPYILKDDIRKAIPGKDFKSRKARSDAYKNNKGRICNKVDIFLEPRVCSALRIELEDKILKINCLKEEESGNTIFMYKDRPIYVIKKKKDKSVIISQKEGTLTELHEFKNYNTAMIFCVCKMLAMRFY